MIEAFVWAITCKPESCCGPLGNKSSTKLVIDVLIPARLDGEIWFEDYSGDGVLSPGEKGAFRLTVSNVGEGAAFNIVTLAIPDTLAAGL